MHKMTEENLKAAFAGESQAHMKYLIFADKAEREHPNVARLFRAIAYAEQVHATSHFKSLAALGSAIANLETAIAGETFEVEEMYPAYSVVASSQTEASALKSMSWALEAEKIHAGLYQDARISIEAGKDTTVGSISICPVCGYTVAGDAVDKCPLCGLAGNKFRQF